MYGSAVCSLVLGLSRGIELYIYGAPQYTMLVFRFPGLHTLRQYKRYQDVTNVYLTIYYNYILL